jgi:hypothetical protein
MNNPRDPIRRRHEGRIGKQEVNFALWTKSSDVPFMTGELFGRKVIKACVFRLKLYRPRIDVEKLCVVCPTFSAIRPNIPDPAKGSKTSLFWRTSKEFNM